MSAPGSVRGAARHAAGTNRNSACMSRRHSGQRPSAKILLRESLHIDPDCSRRKILLATIATSRLGDTHLPRDRKNESASPIPSERRFKLQSRARPASTLARSMAGCHSPPRAKPPAHPTPRVCAPLRMRDYLHGRLYHQAQPVSQSARDRRRGASHCRLDFRRTYLAIRQWVSVQGCRACDRRP